MLASPLLPSPRFAEESSYRPAKDLASFNKLLPPPIEFVEGSSTSLLAVPEGKYQPINESPKVAPTVADSHDSPKPLHPKSAKVVQDTMTAPQTLYAGPIETTWPKNASSGFGLNNIGNTCFLNSALQILLHTPPLLHILNRHATLDLCRAVHKNACMICALRQVAYQESRSRSITPYPIITKLNAIAKHMRRGRQEDSHEFLRYFIDALQRSALAGYPPKLDPKLAEKTWVYTLFGGLLRSRVKCLSCGYDSDTFDKMLDLSVDIAGVMSLKDALRKFVAVDHLRGADKYKCEKCKKAVNADKQFTVQEAPLVLTIHLKRFSPMGRKIGHQLGYDERVNLEPCMSEGQFGPSYSLYGVISHAGGGPNSGHYYAHVKGANGSWYEMNDESVSRHPGLPTNMKNAYILFYIRDKGQTLEAALNAPSASTSRPPAIPAKTGRIAGMKKRRIVESDDEDQRPSPPKVPKRFIGPLLPTIAPQTPDPQPPVRDRSKPDPQAEALKKKIAAVTSPSGKAALASLLQYSDDDNDDDDVGEKVTSSGAEKKEKGKAAAFDDTPVPVPTSVPSTASEPSPVPTATSPTTHATSAPRVASASTSTPTIATIPPSSFYGLPTPKRKENKRKSPDGDDDDAYRKWARTPISPSSSKHSPQRPRTSGANPYSRLVGSNNLQERREDARSPRRRRGHKFLM